MGKTFLEHEISVLQKRSELSYTHGRGHFLHKVFTEFDSYESFLHFSKEVEDLPESHLRYLLRSQKLAADTSRLARHLLFDLINGYLK